MKLKYVVNARIPTEKAHGIQIMKMCESFVIQGINVELIVPRRFNFIKKDPFQYYEIKNNFKITKIFSFDLIRFGFFGFWVQRLSFLFFAKIYLFFKKYDILYTRDEFCGLFFNNFVLEVHSFPDRLRRVHYGVYLKVKKYVVLTSFLKKKIVDDFNISEENIIISPDAVDLEKFDIQISKKEAREKLNLPLDKKIVMYTGKFKTMNNDKGIKIILESLKLLDRKILFVAIGGSQEDIKYYTDVSINFDVSDKVIFINHVFQKKLALYQKASDILLMPFPNIKHYAFFMSPLKMFEYMASKRPIIASNLPSIIEILNDENSVLIDPDNFKKLAEAINYTLQNNSFVNRISKQAYVDVKKYTWEKRVKKIINFIKNNDILFYKRG